MPLKLMTQSACTCRYGSGDYTGESTGGVCMFQISICAQLLHKVPTCAGVLYITLLA